MNALNKPDFQYAITACSNRVTLLLYFFSVNDVVGRDRRIIVKVTNSSFYRIGLLIQSANSDY